jgi:YD repeat-containing protein
MKGAMMPTLTRAVLANQVFAARELGRAARRDRTRWTFAGALLACAIALTSYAGTTSYSYDVHGRLVTIAAPNGSAHSITMNSYDNAGNRQSVVVTGSETTPPNPPTNLTATAQAVDLIRLNWTTSLDVGGGMGCTSGGHVQHSLADGSGYARARSESVVSS